jgi:hypothetical protein
MWVAHYDLPYCGPPRHEHLHRCLLYWSCVYHLYITTATWLPQVRPSPGPRPQPTRCFSQTTLETVTAAVKEWDEGLHSQDTSGYRQVQPSLLAVPLEHR